MPQLCEQPWVISSALTLTGNGNHFVLCVVGFMSTLGLWTGIIQMECAEQCCWLHHWLRWVSLTWAPCNWISPNIISSIGHRKAVGQVIFLGVKVFWLIWISENSWLGWMEMSFWSSHVCMGSAASLYSMSSFWFPMASYSYSSTIALPSEAQMRSPPGFSCSLSIGL